MSALDVVPKNSFTLDTSIRGTLRYLEVRELDFDIFKVVRQCAPRCNSLGDGLPG
jgi:hypothetical protein